MKKRIISLLLLLGFYEITVGLFAITGTSVLSVLLFLGLVVCITAILVFGYCPQGLLKLWDKFPDISLLLAVIGFFISLFMLTDIASAFFIGNEDIHQSIEAAKVFISFSIFLCVPGTFLFILYRNIRDALKKRK